MKSLEEISRLELVENWEEAIDNLEERLVHFPMEKETILRLMFLYWYLIIEHGPIKHNLNLNELETKMKALFERTKSYFSSDAEYLWIMGYMIRFYERDSGDWYEPIFPNLFGEELMKKAKGLSSEYPLKTLENRGYMGKYFQDMIYEI